VGLRREVIAERIADLDDGRCHAIGVSYGDAECQGVLF
jgi:hypothetical protein